MHVQEREREAKQSKRTIPEYFPCDVDIQNIQVPHDPQKYTA